jgi:hypothetical protein
MVLLCLAAAPPAHGSQEARSFEGGRIISGRVVDPHRLGREDTVLMLGRRDMDGFSSEPIPLDADGSFATPPLNPQTYVLKLVRTPQSPTNSTTIVGFTLVTLGASDISGVTVEVRRDTAITGRFRVESDDPQALWPRHIVVNAFLGLDGLPSLDGIVAEGAAGGKFVLRNVFGPRVLRCGYTNAPGSRWWPSQIILDGVDITNVPTDFSAHENGRLEVVFTQHPARLVGTVQDEQGAPVRAPWILVSATMPALRQHWATTSIVVQGNTRGEFSVPVVPGQYVVSAVAQTTFTSYREARRAVLRPVPRGVLADVKAREQRRLSITLQVP